MKKPYQPSAADTARNPGASRTVSVSRNFNPSQRDLILALLERIGGDGHTIFAAAVLAGFPDQLIKRFVRRYDSDGTPKGTIFGKDGQPLKGLLGVYGLTVQFGIASDLGISYEEKSGRGFQARVLTEAIMKHFNQGVS